MGFKSLLEKVEGSNEFKEFIRHNSSAELCAGFFILDFLSNDNKSTLDYKIGEKVFTFELKDDEIKIGEDKLMDEIGRPALVKIDSSVGVDVDELRGIVGVRTLDEGISAKINKIIAVLQKYEGVQIWNLTCMLDGLIILNVHVDTNNGEILKFERKSMMDLIKRVG